MRSNKDIISTYQMVFILILTMIGTGILTLPRNLADAVPYDHWIVLLAGGLVVAIIILVHAWIIRLKPGKQYFDILSDSLTRPLAYIIGLAYVVHIISMVGLLTRLFGEVIKVYLLNRTPIEVINISILATCIYLSRKGIEVLGRLVVFLFPIVLAVIIVLFSLSLLRADFRNLLPVFQVTPLEVLKGMPTTILSLFGLEVVLFFGANLKNPRESTKLTIAVVVVVLFYLLVIVATFSQFGSIQIRKLIWPTLDLFDTIELPGLFIENVQVVVMSAWVITVFTTIAPLYLTGVIMVKSISGFKDQACLAAPLLPFIYFVSLVPKNLAHLYEVVDKYTKYFASVMVIAIPIIVLVSLLIQARLGKEAKSNV